MTTSILDGANPVSGPNSTGPARSQAAPYIDSSTATFQTDVIEQSQNGPVLVDFWAPWCGPCRQLGPLVEKVVAETGGRVRLVKINIDENQALAGQMGVRSIPAVFAFSGGKPVDGFMGALPESEVRAFVKKVLDAAPDTGAGTEGDMNAQIAKVVEAAGQALALGDLKKAGELYMMVLGQLPQHVEALLGLVNTFIKSGTIEQARQTLELVPEGERQSDAYAAAKAGIALAEEADKLDDTGKIRARLAASPNDHQARLDLAMQLNASGDRIEAAEALIEIIKRDREWNEDGARTKLLELFEVWGTADPASVQGRKLLSRLLFS